MAPKFYQQKISISRNLAPKKMEAHMKGLEEIERKKVKYKYDNCIRVSYPTKMYVLIREQAMKESLSIQDLQRKAMDYYLTFSANKKI